MMTRRVRFSQRILFGLAGLVLLWPCRRCRPCGHLNIASAGECRALGQKWPTCTLLGPAAHYPLSGEAGPPTRREVRADDPRVGRSVSVALD